MDAFVGLTLAESSKLLISCIPIGLIAGMIPAVVGLAIWGIVKIFKRA